MVTQKSISSLQQGQENIFPHLPLLRQAYAIIDASVEQVLHQCGRPLACHEGCQHCCHQPIPAALLEVMGLRFFLRHVCPPTIRQALYQAWRPSGSACFFLSPEGRCSAYAFRPMACRRYLLSEQSCTPGEDPTATRPGQMIVPSASAQLRALRLSAPYYVDAGLCATPPHSLEDFKKLSILLSTVAWTEDANNAREQA